MRYIKKRQRFESKTQNLIYYPLTKESFSYKWYRLSHRIEGLVLLNTYPYSKTTAKHIHKIRRQFQSTGTDYVAVHAPQGIPAYDIEPVLTYMKGEIERLKQKNNNKRARGLAKQAREWDIMWMQESVNKISSIMIGREIDNSLAS